MTDEQIDRAAVALWREELGDCAPSVGRARTMERFLEQMDKVQAKFRRMARAALEAATPAPREDGYSAGVRAALPAMERCLSRLDDLPVKHPQQASDKAAFRAAIRALAGQPPV